MNNVEYLESIIEEAQELLEHATAGGDRQYAFDLMADSKELEKAKRFIWDFNTRVKCELAGANRGPIYCGLSGRLI